MKEVEPSLNQPIKNLGRNQTTFGNGTTSGRIKEVRCPVKVFIIIHHALREQPILHSRCLLASCHYSTVPHLLQPGQGLYSTVPPSLSFTSSHHSSYGERRGVVHSCWLRPPFGQPPIPGVYSDHSSDVPACRLLSQLGQGSGVFDGGRVIRSTRTGLYPYHRGLRQLALSGTDRMGLGEGREPRGEGECVRKISPFTNLCRSLAQVSVNTTSIFLTQVSKLTLI